MLGFGMYNCNYSGVKMCHKGQNLLLNNRLGACGPSNLVERGSYNNFILMLIGMSGCNAGLIILRNKIHNIFSRDKVISILIL